MEIIIISALAVLLLLSLILSLSSTSMEIEEDERLQDILDMLPNTNCKACGKLSCKGMAEAILNESIKLSQCKPGTVEMRKNIVDYLSNHPNEDNKYINIKM